MMSQELMSAILPMARFHGLSLASVAPARLAEFWRAALDGTVTDDGAGLRVDPRPHRPANEILRLRPVPRPAPDGARVHLDLRLPGAGPAHLLAAGASQVRGPGVDPWYVLADPEGNEFCAFPAVDDRPAGIFELVVKCRDPHPLADWWASVIGGKAESEGPSAAVAGSPEFPWDYLVFDQVPEPKTVPSRMHWHVKLRDRDPSELLGIGAKIVARPTGGRAWWVLADPEGNEFCAAPDAA
jgi:hypothetical protein